MPPIPCTAQALVIVYRRRHRVANIPALNYETLATIIMHVYHVRAQKLGQEKEAELVLSHADSGILGSSSRISRPGQNLYTRRNDSRWTLTMGFGVRVFEFNDELE